MANVTAGAHIFLAEDISMLILAIISFFGNGFVLFVIVSRPSLRKNESLYLVACLSLADFLLAFCLMPYIIYLIANWSEVINYSAFPVLLLSTPTISEIKTNSMLTVSIALDRFTAVQWPILHRSRNKKRYAICSFILGIIWAAIDGTLLFLMSDFKPLPGCAASGCFMGDGFRYYWGVSNMMVNLISMATTMLLLLKLHALKKAVAPTSNRAVSSIKIAEKQRFENANMIAVNVLLVSGICIFIPNSCAGLGEMFGLAFYRKLGPIVSFGLVLSGVFNSIIYGMKHRDIRLAIPRLLNKNHIATISSTQN